MSKSCSDLTSSSYFHSRHGLLEFGSALAAMNSLDQRMVYEVQLSKRGTTFASLLTCPGTTTTLAVKHWRLQLKSATLVHEL